MRSPGIVGGVGPARTLASLLLSLAPALLVLVAATPAGAVAVGGAFGGPTRLGGATTYWNAAAVGDAPDTWVAMAELSVLSFGATFARAGRDPNTGEYFELTRFDHVAPNPTFTLAAPTPWPALQVVAGGFSPLSQAVFWPDEGPHRYHAIDSRMVTYGVSVNLAWHITKWLTVAVGGGPVFGSLHMGYAMDFGSYANGELPPGSQAMPLEDPQLEGAVDGNATGWGAMAAAGLWAHPVDWLRLGFNVILPSKVNVHGDVDLESSAALDAALPGFEIASTGALDVGFPLYPEAHFEAEVALDPWRLGFLATVYPTPKVREIRAVITGSEAEFLNGEIASYNDPRHDWLLGLRVARRLGQSWEAGARVDVDPRSIPAEVEHPGNMDFTSIHLGAGGRWYLGPASWLELSATHLVIFRHTVDNSVYSPNAPPDSGLAMPSANGEYGARGFLVSLGYVGVWGD